MPCSFPLYGGISPASTSPSSKSSRMLGGRSVESEEVSFAEFMELMNYWEAIITRIFKQMGVELQSGEIIVKLLVCKQMNNVHGEQNRRY